MQQVSEGLYVMVFGMVIVFAALVTIMFVMIALEKAFPLREAGEAPAPPPPAAVEPPASQAKTPPAGGPQSEVAAAVSVAIAHARARAGRPSGALPVRLGEDSDQWDWLWEEGIDDYGTTRGSRYANV